MQHVGSGGGRPQSPAYDEDGDEERKGVEYRPEETDGKLNPEVVRSHLALSEARKHRVHREPVTTEVEEYEEEKEESEEAREWMSNLVIEREKSRQGSLPGFDGGIHDASIMQFCA